MLNSCQIHGWVISYYLHSFLHALDLFIYSSSYDQTSFVRPSMVSLNFVSHVIPSQLIFHNFIICCCLLWLYPQDKFSLACWVCIWCQFLPPQLSLYSQEWSVRLYSLVGIMGSSLIGPHCQLFSYSLLVRADISLVPHGSWLASAQPRNSVFPFWNFYLLSRSKLCMASTHNKIYR